jgi:hypothetical protein
MTNGRRSKRSFPGSSAAAALPSSKCRMQTAALEDRFSPAPRPRSSRVSMSRPSNAATERTRPSPVSPPFASCYEAFAMVDRLSGRTFRQAAKLVTMAAGGDGAFLEASRDEAIPPFIRSAGRRDLPHAQRRAHRARLRARHAARSSAQRSPSRSAEPARPILGSRVKDSRKEPADAVNAARFRGVHNPTICGEAPRG